MATNKLPINTDTLLILEKGFESEDVGRQAVENLNVIEQLLAGICEELNENYPAFQAKFIVRRLPPYLVPYFNKNEYAIILETLDFTVSTPNASVSESDSVSVDGKPIKIHLGHTEIFRRDGTEDGTEPTASASRKSSVNGNGANHERAYGSHEIFQRFSAAFVKSFGIEIEREAARNKDVDQVQLIGAHLLYSVKINPEVPKIFKLTQPEVKLSLKKKSRCKLQVNHESSILVIELDGTEAIVRPALFLDRGYPKIHVSILERIPLYHPSILTIGESLLKGCFLMPTNYETLWTIQFWPAESHIIFGFHPSSIVGRVFKLYGTFCLNPTNFWENLNSCFLIGVEDIAELHQNVGVQSLTIDFVMSSFLHELEQLPDITDWEPKQFSTRFTDLLAEAVQSYDKGLHYDYFTKRNVLRNLWKPQGQQFGELDEDDAGLEHVDSVRSASVPPGDQVHLDQDEDDEFGLHFEELSVADRDENNKFGPPRRKSTLNSTIGSSREELPRQSRSLSKYIGTTILRRLSMGTVGVHDRDMSPLKTKTNRSMTDIAAGFVGMVNQQRREQIRCRDSSVEEIEMDDVFASSVAFVDNSNRPGTSRGIVNEACDSKDSIYATIFQLLNEISPSNYLSNKELITHLDNCRRVLGSQGELILAWTQVINEIPRPKHICPHTFSPRQIQSISMILQVLSKCTMTTKRDIQRQRLPAWEIIGDILRIALHQMRSEGNLGRKQQESLKVKRKRSVGFSFKGLRTSASFSEGSTVKPAVAKSSSRVSKLSFRGASDICKYHTDAHSMDPDTETALALEEPETAATHRLLQWLWQLRNSEIGRLSRRAQKFMECLYNSSLIQSHFLEQVTERKLFESMAIRSAVAVTRIMTDEKYQTYVPLTTAAKRGWLWSDMVLSFAGWNEDKGNIMRAKIPLINSAGYVMREIRTMPTTSTSAGPISGHQTLKRIHNPTEPDTDALNLAFHSELATPLGMYDFEDPLCPGPYTVPILIFTSLGYFSQWEVAPGNIIHALVRLQKFIVLQHIATMLLPPHRKTAINEVRKLSKSLAFTAFQFEDNVMTKTFRRLASLRHSRRLFSSSPWKGNAYNCDEANCQNPIEGDSKVCQYKGKSIECTKF